jgi:hypothetical protein
MFWRPPKGETGGTPYPLVEMEVKLCWVSLKLWLGELILSPPMGA